MNNTEITVGPVVDPLYELILELERKTDEAMMLVNELQMYNLDNRYDEVTESVRKAGGQAADLLEQLNELKKHDNEANQS